MGFEFTLGLLTGIILVLCLMGAVVSVVAKFQLIKTIKTSVELLTAMENIEE
jgi:hypothetical protein